MRIFISDSGEKGKRLASQLATRIKVCGHDVWTYNNSNYTYGDIAWCEIYSEIINRDLMIVIIDESAQGNNNQENEYTFALKNGLMTFALVRNGVSIPDKLKGRNVGW